MIDARVEVTEAADVAEFTAQVISNFAWQHLRTAALFRDRVIEIEAANKDAEFGSFFEDIRSYASASIMCAAASLEALINELFIASNLRLRQMFKNFEAEFWGDKGIERKKPTLAKYQLALKMLGAPCFDQDRSPYCDARALLDLRHALVHFKPVWEPGRPRKVDLVQALLQGELVGVELPFLVVERGKPVVAQFRFVRRVPLLSAERRPTFGYRIEGRMIDSVGQDKPWHTSIEPEIFMYVRDTLIENDLKRSAIGYVRR